MNIEFKHLDLAKKYHLMIQTVVPRPIAWVLSKNLNGTHNLAPFSYFNAICGEPPLIMMSIGHKKDGSKKDTWENIEREKEFIVHIASSHHADAMTKSAFEHPADVSEVDELGLKIKHCFSTTSLPRLEDAKIAFACVYHDHFEIGKYNQGIIMGEIKSVFIDDSIATENNGRISVDALKLDPLGRLGGSDYGALGRKITVKR